MGVARPGSPLESCKLYCREAWPLQVVLGLCLKGGEASAKEKGSTAAGARRREGRDSSAGVGSPEAAGPCPAFGVTLGQGFSTSTRRTVLDKINSLVSCSPASTR